MDPSLPGVLQPVAVVTGPSFDLILIIFAGKQQIRRRRLIYYIYIYNFVRALPMLLLLPLTAAIYSCETGLKQIAENC